MVDDVTLGDAISRFAAETTKKLSALSARGEPEDQIRAPLTTLVDDLADICRVGRRNVVTIGESSIADLKTRPDFAVQRHGALVGYIEVKAPRKGADPRRFKDKHDRDQWLKLKVLPNLIYTDGNGFSLWRDGELVGKIVRLDGDIATDGGAITEAPGLAALFDDFLSWEPIPPRSPKHLAELTARVCRLMRDEVAEQLTLGNPALTELARDWRALLFPEADERTFADGYAQAVTFGLLVARSRGISVAGGISAAAKEVGTTHSLIGSALFVLTLNTESHDTLKTSVGTLTRVLEVVDWPKISKGKPEAWLYFYEEFLSVYDTVLRRKTGSYYTPPEVVSAMTGFVENALRTRFRRPQGLATGDVTLVDPAVGTGTFLLAALRSIAATVEADQGAGAVSGMIEDALKRLIRVRNPARPVRRRSAAAPCGAGRSRRLDVVRAAHVRHRHACQPVHRGREARIHLRTDRRIAKAGQRDQEEPARARRHWQPAVQGEGEGSRRLDRAGKPGGQRQSTAGRVVPTHRLGCRRARQAPSEPLRVLLALGNLESVRSPPRRRQGHRLLHHRRRVPQWARLPEDA